MPVRARATRLPRVTALAVALAVASAAVACGSDATAPPPDNEQACEPNTASVQASVSAGTEVVFDWTPACEVALLLVEPLDAGTDLWGITVDDGETNGIAPPVTYGVAPAGVDATDPAVELTVGEVYELILWRVLPDGGPVLLTVHAFTR